MSRFDKKAIATALAFATFLGNKASAMNIVMNAAITLGSAYVTANEIAGDIGLVNHPLMGRFTIKKTFEYFMRDVKKEEALINRIIEFIDKSGADKSLEKNIEIERYSSSIEGREDQIKSAFLASLKTLKDLLISTKKALSEGFATYSLGMYEFDLSKNSIFISVPALSSIKKKVIAEICGIKIKGFDWWSSNLTMFANIALTLNKDGSLTIKGYVPNINFNSQFTISTLDLAPALKK